VSLIGDLCAEARARAAELDRSGLPPVRGAPASITGQSFIDAIKGKDRLKVIAEFKRQSPSRGSLAPDREITEQVKCYERAKAAALSVLTEPRRFGGSLEDLEAASRSVDLPVLMKDFVVDPIQVSAAARSGARAVLLIVRCLERNQLFDLALACEASGLATLVECHDPREIETALSVSGAAIGINNRDLETLKIDQLLAERLLPLVPGDRVAVAESGYEAPEETEGLRGLADAVLIGSALMTSGDPSAFIRRVGR
jgi:indole-3-glycerol phosphate synthase